MLIYHLSDIHYCEQYLAEVDSCMDFAIARIREDPPALIVLSGDLFDYRLQQNAPAFLAAVRRVSELGGIAPVFILQGTFTHDSPGALEVFEHVESEHPIYVADRIHQVAWHNARASEFRPSDGWAFEDDVLTELVDRENEGGVLLSCLPTINKGAVAAAVGAEQAGEAVGDHVAALLQAWAPKHEIARRAGIPSVIITHGTVAESVSEHGVPMAGPDNEYRTGTLFSAQASAVMAGHIHKHQAWEKDGRCIAYPGSLGRLHYGEIDPKGFLRWDVQPDRASFEFIETPAKRLVDIEFAGTPDMEALREAAETAAGAHVRIRYQVDEEHREAVDEAAIEALFAAAAEVKTEGTVNPIIRQRAAGIGRMESIGEKLVRWCELTDTDSLPLLERLSELEAGVVDTVIEDLP